MPDLDLSHFELSDPRVTRKGVKLDEIRYADLNYSSRIKALLVCTRDVGKPLDAEVFNDLLNGRRSVQYVMDFVKTL